MSMNEFLQYMLVGSWVKVGTRFCLFEFQMTLLFIVRKINRGYSFSQLQHVEQVGDFETILSRLDGVSVFQIKKYHLQHLHLSDAANYFKGLTSLGNKTVISCLFVEYIVNLLPLGAVDIDLMQYYIRSSTATQCNNSFDHRFR